MSNFILPFTLLPLTPLIASPAATERPPDPVATISLCNIKTPALDTHGEAAMRKAPSLSRRISPLCPVLILLSSTLSFAGPPRRANPLTAAAPPATRAVETHRIPPDTLDTCLDKASRFAVLTFFDLDRASALEAVAAVRYEAGDPEGARRNLAEARRNIESESFVDIRPGAYLHLADTYERGGDHQLALLALESGVRDAAPQKDPHLRGIYLLPLAEAQAKCHAPGADATWELVSKAVHEERVFRSFDLAELAGGFARAGRFVDARTTAGEIDEDLCQSLAWQAIATAMLKAHDVKSATRAAELISVDFVAQETLSKIAVAQADSGDVAAASRVLARLTDDNARSDALPAIVRATLRAGDSDNATSLAAAISEPYCHLDAAIILGQASMKAGKLDAARKWAAAAMKDAGQVEDDAWSLRCRAFCRAATVQANVGDFAAAWECLAHARLALDKVNGNDIRWEGPRKWELVRNIVVSQIDTGDIDGAKQTAAAMNIENAEGEHALACQAIAFALTRNDGVSAAGHWIDTLVSNRARALAWVGAAQALLPGEPRAVHPLAGDEPEEE